MREHSEREVVEEESFQKRFPINQTKSEPTDSSAASILILN